METQLRQNDDSVMNRAQTTGIPGRSKAPGSADAGADLKHAMAMHTSRSSIKKADGWFGDEAERPLLTGCSWAANRAGAVAMPLARSLSAGLPSMLLLPV